MSNKRTDCSNMTVAIQKKNGGKHAVNVTDHKIPYRQRPQMERPAVKGNINRKTSCQSPSFTREDVDMT